ncbi:hypothetical protein JZ751_008896 [Albula glossodonta]|uniref:Uncharacterized protein n=1 Tax=Albula glossodonta TaxID=121402 RepID=A0A8T2P808_9TELE|nr:hypothetical protein JZ751_008896 [Albula glossodonta]
MDENYNILPHGVNFQDAIFPDTLENRRTFSSLFQFSNCSHGQALQTFTPEWETQEDSRVRAPQTVPHHTTQEAGEHVRKMAGCRRPHYRGQSEKEVIPWDSIKHT